MKEDYKKLLEDSKEYLKTRYDLLRLELLDKLSLILGLLVLIIVALFILLAAIAYFSVALVGWMAACMPVSVACCILGGVLLIILLAIYLLRRQLFIDPFVKLLSSSLFTPKDEDETINPDDNETTV
ncbi:MAG: phage holin family protein [Paludibacteraceae bacterium]|nr:phage holin family protein [Paludibacteraceae bacterium]